MLKDLNMPRMGSVENARMVGWRVAEGAAFQTGDVLYEVETDKTTTEVEADEPGILARQFAVEGDEFKVGDRVGLWAAPGSRSTEISKAIAALDGHEAQPVVQIPEVAALPAVTSPQQAHAKPVPRSAAGGNRISPLARRLAALHEVDVGQVVGTGPNGRITADDVRNAVGGGTPTAASPPIAPQPKARALATTATDTGEYTVIPHSMRRQTIARRMVQSASIPTRTADMEIDLTGLFAARKKMPGVSILGLVAHETVSVLGDFPQFNAHWRDDALVQWNTIHLGIAVDTPGGLVVPVIRNAERLNPKGLTAAIASLADTAREGKLSIEQIEGSTFTISNPGSIGPVIHTEALINPPEVAILSLPGIVRAVQAVPDGEGWATVIRPVLRPSLTFDHRAVDGGPVVEFLNALKRRIEAL